MRHDPSPLAAVTLTWRDAPGAIRARAALPMEPEVRRSLRTQGARGFVEVHTCARSLWLISATQPAWAGALWQSHVASRIGGALLPTLHTGEDAFHHALRVAVGLDSYVQGEGDIGGQVSRAFTEAREIGDADVVLNQLGQSVAKLVADGRDHGFIRPNRGLGQLSVEALGTLGADRERPVAVVGLGEIGHRAMASLRRAGWPSIAYNRSPKTDALPLDSIRATPHEAVIVCTAGPARWFVPPSSARFVVDLGVPAQVSPRPGVTLVGMDELLAGDPLALSAEVLEQSEAAVRAELKELQQRVRQVQVRRGLGGIGAIRDQFIHEELEAVLAEGMEGLPTEQRRRIMRAAQGAIRRYNHRVLGWLKDELAVQEER